VVELKCNVRPAWSTKDRAYSKPEEYGWCLYAIIGKGHPLFAQLQTEDTEKGYYTVVSSLLDEMPLHSGCTFYEYREANDSPTIGDYRVPTITVGCDYSHHRDQQYMDTSIESFEAGQGMGGCLLRDMDSLLAYLDSYIPQEEEPKE
jgi:hypothetical protein